MRVRCLVIAALCGVSLLGTAAAGYGEEAAPEYGWKNRLVAYLNLSQAGFDNWVQGGENTLGWQIGLNGKATNTGLSHEWTHEAKLAYGMTKVGDDDAIKSVDEIKIESVFTYKAGFWVDPYAAATAETQFSKGYEYTEDETRVISNFLDPGYFTQSAGVRRVLGEVLRSRLGVSLKETVTDEYPIPYADDPETPGTTEKTKVEVGAESITDLNLILGENLLFTSKLELFSNLEAANEIDVNWDNQLTAKVEKYVNVSLNVRIFYDADMSRKRQVKEALAIGLTYSFL